MIVSQPSLSNQLNRNHPLSKGLIRCFLMNEGGGLKIFDSTGLQRTIPALTGGAIFQKSTMGNAIFFDGSSDYIPVTVDLSPYQRISISVWVNWTSYANDDDLMMEYRINGTTSGGFGIDPNSTTAGGGKFEVFWGWTGVGTSNATFPRPSAGIPHHYVFNFDSSVSGGSGLNSVYVDGVVQTLTNGVTGSSAGSFANDILYVMCRSGNQLFGAGLMNRLMIYNRFLSQTEARWLYTNPYGMFKESRIKRFKETEIVNRFKFNNSGVRPRPFAPGLAR